MTVHIAHKVEIDANNEFKTYCRRAFGVHRLAHNWCVEQIKDRFSRHESVSVWSLLKEFNSIKYKQYPYVLDVTSTACTKPFMSVDCTLKQWNRARKSGKKNKVGFPTFMKKSYSKGSFYMGGDKVRVEYGQSNIKDEKIQASLPKANSQYLWIPKHGWVRLKEEVRFEGRIVNVTISQDGDRFYASFCMEISENVLEATHRPSAQESTVCGCDWGVKDLLTISSENKGVKVKGRKAGKKIQRKLKIEQRRLDRKVHPRTKGDKTKKSKNFLKQARKVNKLHRKARAQRADETHKLSTVLARHCQFIGVETLNAQGMMANHHVAAAVLDNCPYTLKSKIMYKSAWRGGLVAEADMFYASSKTCSNCGYVNRALKLGNRIYRCSKCGHELDRDVNAGLNLEKIARDVVGRVTPEHGKKLKPVDLSILLEDLVANQLVTAGEKQEFSMKHCKL